MGNDCLFCKIAAGEIPCDRVYADDDVVAFRDINPQAPTHILVIPRRHMAKLTDAGPDDAALLGKLLAAANAIAREEGVAEGFRCVVNCGADAGQSVWHIHVHVLGGRPLTWPPG